MHHKIHIALYTLCFVAWYSTISCGYAQDNKKNDDTTKVYRYGEVVITATHLPLEGHQPPTSRSVLTHEEIERMNARSLADVLSSAEGIFVKDYGGSSGLKTISQRGLGAEHTLILLNGFRLSEFQNGLVDLGLLLTDDIDRVEIIRGGHSSEYGADAVTGVVNIITGTPTSIPSIRLRSSFGSFGYRRYGIAGGVSLDLMKLSAAYQEEKSSDDFTFRFSNGNLVSDVTRKNADFLSRTGYLRGEAALVDYHLTAFVQAHSSERGVGGPVVSPYAASRSRQVDKDYIGQLFARRQLDHSALFSVGTQIHYSYERYVDPDVVVGSSLIDNYFRNIDARVLTSLSYQPSETMKWSFGSEIAQAWAIGNSMEEDVSRSQIGVFLTSEHHLQLQGIAVSEIVFSPSFRYDATSLSYPLLSPQLGIVAVSRLYTVGLIERLMSSLRATVSRNFRLPTFNELYYSGGGGFGNRSLKPERSINADLGGTLSFYALADHAFSLSYFFIGMDDRIVWVASGGSAVTPKNLSHVQSEGVEFRYTLTMFDHLLNLQTSYSGLHTTKTSEDYPGDPTAGKQLIYIPQESFDVLCSCSKSFDGVFLNRIGGTVQYHFVGFRYYTQDNSSFLPSYRVVNANLQARFRLPPVSMNLKWEVNNLFDEDYQVIVAYPIPLRSYRLTLGIEY